MVADELVRRLASQQSESGAFRSTMRWRGRPDLVDENGFTTALVLRRLRRLAPPTTALTTAVQDKALDFLESCAMPPQGAFSFWPAAARPGWASGIGADADDTAVVTLELLAHGRRSSQEAVDVVIDVLVAALTGACDHLGPPWLRPHVFPTWLPCDQVARRPVLDCAVNANVVALMAVVGCHDLPGYEQAVEMIGAAVRWSAAGGSDGASARADTIAPYYASPRAVVEVLDDAVWCGVEELSEARDQLAEIAGPPTPGTPTTLWRNAYAGPVWRCPALDLVSADGQPDRSPALR